MNEVLGATSKSFDNQRRIRSVTIQGMNQKLLQVYGVKEGIETQAETEDKRFNTYRLKKGLAEKLTADKRLA